MLSIHPPPGCFGQKSQCLRDPAPHPNGNRSGRIFAYPVSKTPGKDWERQPFHAQGGREKLRKMIVTGQFGGIKGDFPTSDQQLYFYPTR
jgi:hypothetical protein